MMIDPQIDFRAGFIVIQPRCDGCDMVWPVEVIAPGRGLRWNLRLGWWVYKVSRSVKHPRYCGRTMTGD